MADMGLGILGAGAGAGDAIGQLFDQRLKAAQLGQQDALTRLKIQELADARAETLANRNDLAAERTAHQKELEHDKAEQRARQNFPLIPLNTPVSGQTVQDMTSHGIPQEAFRPMPDTADVPASIAAPGQSNELPGTVANSPLVPVMRSYYRNPTQTETASMENADLKQQLADAKASQGPKADDRFDSIVALQAQGKPVSAEDAAFVKAYKERKTLGPALSTGAADARQAQSEDFTKQQVGRKELSDNVEKPFRDAQAAASELRDIVTSAKAGNKFAASQQALVGALATIRGMGLNRLPPAEAKAAGQAGSLWDRIQGLVGRQAAGQPIDAEMQKALLDYADVLDKSAEKKYRDGFASITKRYGLTDEKPIVAEDKKLTPEELIQKYGR